MTSVVPFAVLLIGLALVPASSGPEQLAMGETVELEHAVELPAIQPFEITGQQGSDGSFAFSEGSWSRGRSVGRSDQLNFVIERKVEGLWSVWVPAGFDLRQLRANYTVEGHDGRTGFLSNESGSHVRVTVVPTPPAVVAASNGWELVEGSVRLRFHLASARRAGAYGGAVHVTLTGG